MKVFTARVNRARTKLICGVCDQPMADWIERDEGRVGERNVHLRQAQFPEGIGYDDESGAWRMSNRARNRQMSGEPARRYAVDRVPVSHVETFDVHGSAELVAWLSSLGVPMHGSSHAEEDQRHVRQQAGPPFEIHCPHCGRRNRIDG